MLHDPGVLTALTGLLVTLGGGAAWLIRRHDSKKDPLPRAQAEVAVAAGNLGLLSEVNLRLAEESRRVSAELVDVRTQLREVVSRAAHNDRQIADLQVAHGQIKALFGSATGFIEELLRWLHAGMPGDRPELPSSLRAFVDETLHGQPFGSHRPDPR